MRRLVKMLVSGLSALIVAGSAAAQQAGPDQVITYKKIGGRTLTLHVFNPPGLKPGEQRPAIVFFFGGGWVSGDPSHFYNQSRYLAAKGMVAVCADYRTRNKDQTTPAECVKDGKSAMRWVRSHAEKLCIDPDRLAAGGGSAGGHVAAAVAALKGFNEGGEDTSVSCRPDALILFNPVFDNGPGGYGHDRVTDYWQDFSPLHNIDKSMPPTLVMLGTKDVLVPVSAAEKYKARMEESGLRCDLILYEGQPHGFFNKDKYSETMSETEAFLVSLGWLAENSSVTKE
jgi:acetyl esterase/lipase